MEKKIRPVSSIRRPSTQLGKYPINQNENTQIVTNRQTLTNLIPDMPALMPKNKSSTAILYSKFIVKGIKTNKVDLVKQSFNMRKQNFRYEKKLSLNMMKSIKSTRNSTKHQAYKSIQPESNQQAMFLQNSNYMDNSKILNLEINNYFRINSNRQTQTVNQTQRKMLKTGSENILKRPKSAFNTPNKGGRQSRAHTANFRKANRQPQRQNFQSQFKAIIPQKNLLTITQKQGIQPGFIDHVRRNKRQLSASSKKTSIYLTGVDNHKIIQTLNNQLKKVPAKRMQQVLKSHAYKSSMPQLPFQQNLQEIYLESNRLSQNQIKNIQTTNKKNIDFMKKNMPVQYKKFVEYLVMKQNNFSQKDKVLMSSDMQGQKTNQNQFGEINMNSANQKESMNQALEYFREYAHLCEETEYYINKNLKRQPPAKHYNEVLHSDMCRKLFQLQQNKKKLQKYASPNFPQGIQQKITQINLQIYEIVKILSFFKSKADQVCKKIFKLKISLKFLEQQDVIIQKGDPIDLFYVILNGSVMRKTQIKIKDQDQGLNKTQNPNQKKQKIECYTYTLFDGQTFGQPGNPMQKYHNSQFICAQKVILMTFSFQQYKKICAQNENIEDKIKLLQPIFGNVPGCKVLDKRDLQVIAFQMESSPSFNSKDVVFRRQDFCDKLIIVGAGKISLVHEHILKRPKKVDKDMKKRPKSTQKLNVKSFSVTKLRRQNLKNYQVLQQNDQQFIFYYQDSKRQLIRGDVLNWQGFSFKYRKSLLQEQYQKGLITQIQSQYKQPQYKLQYSLISNTDNSKIYTLNLQKIKNLPQQLKEVIYSKIEDMYKKTKQIQSNNNNSNKQNQKKMETIYKWDEYKQQMCNDILSRKLKI